MCVCVSVNQLLVWLLSRRQCLYVCIRSGNPALIQSIVGRVSALVTVVVVVVLALANHENRLYRHRLALLVVAKRRPAKAKGRGSS